MEGMLWKGKDDRQETHETILVRRRAMRLAMARIVVTITLLGGYTRVLESDVGVVP